MNTPPRFQIHLGDLLRETGHLRAMLFGAYILLLAHHWAMGELPDDDEQLSSIARLTPAEWKKARSILIKLFDEGWHHARVAADLAASKESYVKRARAGEKGGKAKAAAWQSSSNATAAPQQPLTFNQCTSISSLRSENHIDKPVVVVVAREPEKPASTTTTTKAVEGIGLQKLPAERSSNPLGTALPETWVPDESCVDVAHGQGMTRSDIDGEVLRFHAVNTQRGTFSQNWNSTWTLWCAEWKRRATAAAAKAVTPRLEVSSAVQITTEMWHAAAKTWAKQQRWSRYYGNEPGMGGCQCPQAILIKHGIDPATGMVKAVASMRSYPQ